MNALELRTAVVLAAIYMFRMLGLFMVMPVLAISAQEFSDYSPILLGIAIGGYGLVQACLQIPMGTLSDRFGRKAIIITGLMIFAVGSVVAAKADSLLALVVGRFLQGGGAIASALMALATDVAREKARPIVMAIIGISIGFSFYIAVLVGPIITAHFGVSGIFWFTAIGALSSIPLLYFLVPNTRVSLASKDVIPSRSGLVYLATKTQLWRLNVNVFLLHLSITLLFVPLPLLLSKLGLNLHSQWTMYLPVLLISIVGLGALMAIYRANKHKKAFTLACACMMSGFASLALGELTFTYVVIAGALFFTGFNFLEASFPSMVSQLAPAGEKGSAMGLYASFQFSGAFVGGVTAGAVLELFAIKTVLLLGVAVVAFILVISLKLQAMPKLKRYTIELNASIADVSSVVARVKSIEGVIDAKAAENRKALYVKALDSLNPKSINQVLDENYA